MMQRPGQQTWEGKNGEKGPYVTGVKDPVAYYNDKQTGFEPEIRYYALPIGYLNRKK